MLALKTHPSTPASPEESRQGNDEILLDNEEKEEQMESNNYKRRRNNYYQPSVPLGLKYFEKTFFIFNYGKIPFHIHICLLFYMLMTMIFAILHNQALSWLALILILLIIQIFIVFLQVLVCVYIANKLNVTIHRILFWPFGSIGYCTNYNEWTHFVIVEYAAHCFHLLIFVLFWGICAILDIANWSYSYPINVYFGHNILNGIWSMNIIIATLHVCIPIYSMKSARFMVLLLYKKRRRRQIAQILILPSLFLSILLLLFGIVDQKPNVLFLSMWGMYQTMLLWNAYRKGLVAKLPLFQMMERRRKKKEDETKKMMMEHINVETVTVEQKEAAIVKDEVVENTENQET